VKVSGNKLTINLTAAHPDFLSRIAMPFFCAVPTNTPLDPQGVNAPAGAGPYYIQSRTPKRPIVLAKNPNYHGSRPANLDKIIYTVGISPDAALLQTKAGQIDWGADESYPTEYADLWNKYGPTSAAGKSGKQQFYVAPTLEVQYLAMNTSRGV